MKIKQIRSDWQPATDQWLESLTASNYSQATIQTRYSKLRHLAELANVPPQDLTIEILTHILATQQWKPETRKGYKNTIASFLKYCYKHHIIDEDLAAELPSMKRGTPKPRPCPDRIILAALRKAEPQDRIIIRLAAECGLRRSEIAQVHAHDIVTSVEGYSLIVHGKGDKQRSVPIVEDLAKQIQDKQGFVFEGRWSGHVEASYIGRHASRLLTKPYNTHSLRHRYATQMYAVTHDILLVSQLLGHASVDTTQRYVAVPFENLTTAIEAIRLQ